MSMNNGSSSASAIETSQGSLDLSKETLLTAKEVAARMNVSVDTVYRHVPCRRIAAGVIRYAKADIDRFLKSNALPCARRPRSRFVPRKQRL